MKDFAANLSAQLEAKPKLSMREQRIKSILDAPPSKRKDRRLARMENHARAAINADPKTGAIDWSTIDWAKLLSTIIDILAKLLPLILAL